MGYEDKELMEEAYGEVLDEGRMDQFKAKGASMGSKWKGKTFNALGKMTGSQTLQDAGEEFADKATQQRTEFMTNKFSETIIKDFTAQLKESIQDFTVLKSESERKYEEMDDDLAKLNLTDQQREDVNAKFESLLATHYQNIETVILTLKQKASTEGYLRSQLGNKGLMNKPEPKPEQPPVV